MKRFLAILLSVLMLWSVLPINGIAEELTETLQVATEPAVIGTDEADETGKEKEDITDEVTSAETSSQMSEEIVSESIIDQEASVKDATETETSETVPDSSVERTDIQEPSEEASHTMDDTSVKETEISMPRMRFEDNIRGAKVVVQAEEGTFPEGTKMNLKLVGKTDVLETVQDILGTDVADLLAVDISFLNSEGIEIQPLKEVKVQIITSVFDEKADLSVVHVESADKKEAEIIKGVGFDGDVAEFKADSFSIYIVVATDQTPADENAVATYKFYVGDELKITQYIKTGDKITDPGSYDVGADDANTVFKGWFIGDTEVDFNTVQTVDETEEIRVDAKIQHTYYVTFWGEKDDEGNRGIVAVKSVTVEGEGKGNVTTDDVIVTPKADTSAFKGWATDDAGTTMAGNTVEVSDRMNLYAVIVNANWIHFYENVGEDSDSDATYTGPVFIAETDTRSSKKPADPERKGYTFGGWYLDAACSEGKEFDWSATGLESDTNVYAKWIPAEANLKVIVWKQKVTDSKDAADSDKTYDFEMSAEYTSTTGEDIDLSEYSMYKELDYTGFHYARMEAVPEKVKADGTTVVNVYYDRNLLTIKFVDGTHEAWVEAAENDYSEPQYGLIDGQYVALSLEGNWYSGFYWTYQIQGTYSGTTYREANNDQGTQYGFKDGEMVRLTRNSSWFGYDYYWTYPDGEVCYGDRYKTPANGNRGFGVVDGEVVGISNQNGEWVYTTDVRYTGTRYKLATEPDVTEFTGLYGSSLESNGYEWPGERAWYQNPNSGGTRLTFLDAFKFEGLSGTSEGNTVLTQYGANQSGQNYISFYKQNVDGTYPTTPTNSIRSSSNGTFTITEKYDGFKAVQYRNFSTGWTSGGAGTTADVYQLEIRFERQKYSLTFISDGEEVGVKTGIPYEALMSGYKIADPTKAHYNFEGWFEDPTGQTAFNWSSKMPAANKVVYAKWTPKQYHVSLDANGGTLQNAQDAEFNVPLDTILSKSSLVQNVTKAGHELVGWFNKETGEAYGYGKVQSDVKLIAKWRYPGQVQIVYDAGEHGSGAPADDYKYATDSSVVLGAPPTTVDEGYGFVGWEVAGTRYYTNNTFDITEDIIENYNETTKTGTVTIKAIYQDLSKGAYETTLIVYNANGGTGTDIVVKPDNSLLVNEPVKALTLAATGFERTGYDFKGWNTMPDGTGLAVAEEQDIAADLRDLTKNGKINTLYAQWEQIKYTVIYTDGVEGEEVFADKETKDLVEGDDTPEFGTDPVRDGYKFTGWDPEVAATVTGDDADEERKIIYTAIWAETVKVVYTDGVDGEEVFADKETDGLVDGDDTPAFGTDPVRDGYVFAGWDPEVDAKVSVAKATDGVITYTAQWDKLYVLKYEYEGKVPEGVPAVPEQKTYKAGATVPAAAVPELTGYTFEGWTNEPSTMPAADTTVTGKWTINVHKVTYEYEGTVPEGAPAVPAEKEYEYGAAVPKATVPTLTGYTFSGWATEPESMPDEDVVVKGSWTVNVHKVTYEYEGTVPEGAPAVPAEKEYEYGAAVPKAEVPTLTGYTFSGWTTEPETMPDEDVVVKGSWTINSHKVTYKYEGTVPEGAPAVPAEATYEYGATVPAATVPELEGYTFTGWTGEVTTMPDNDVTVTGTWTINSYKVTYEYEGEIPEGAPALPAEATYEYGASVPKAEVPTLTGYTFSGWKTEPETMPANDVVVKGSWTINSHKVTYQYEGDVPQGAPAVPEEKEYEYGATVPAAEVPELEGYTFEGWTGEVDTMPDNDVTVTGKWTVNTHKVIYEYEGQVPQGAPAVPEEKEYEYGATVSAAEVPELEGYTFSGWTGEVDTMPDEDVTVTGSWTINSHKVTYQYEGQVPQGAPAVPEEKEYEYGATVPAAEVPELEGYTFEGWTGEVSTMPDEDVEVTGKWTREIRTITINVIGNTETVTYNGSEQSVTGYGLDCDSDLFDPDKVVFDGEASAKGTDAGTYEMGLSAEQFSYDDDAITAVFEITDGWLKIEEEEEETFVITYDLNGGTYDGKQGTIEEEYPAGTVISIHEAPEREGYEFTYWKGSEYQPGDSYTVEGDHTFTAQWKKNEEEHHTPKTGDESNLGLWMALMIISLMSLGAMFFRRKNESVT